MRKRTHAGKTVPPRHDPGYKSLFSHPTMVEELLRGFVRQDWIEHLDFSTLERMSNSFVSEDLRERHGDLIWRLRLRGDADEWVYLYLLLEFQSTSDRFMAVRQKSLASASPPGEPLRASLQGSQAIPAAAHVSPIG